MAAKETQNVRIGLSQIDPTVGDLDGNSSLIAVKIGQAKRLGIDLLAFPELSICGYPTEDLVLKPSFLEECERHLLGLAPRSRGIAVIVGAPWNPGGKGAPVYNTAVLLHRGRIAARYCKMHLPNYGVFDEKRYFVPGQRGLVASFGGVRVGLSVCEDIWMKNGPAAAEAKGAGASILVNISASPYNRRKGPERERLMRRRARECGSWLCYVNLLGGQDELVFDGSSVVCSPDGRTVARGIPFREDLIVVDIPAWKRLPERALVRSRSFFRPPAIPVDRIVLSPFAKRPKPKIPARKKARHLEPHREIYEALVLGTRDYVDKNGFGGVVLGISGGIDSALAAAIAADALGPGRVTGVTMPSGYTSPATLSDAGKLAENLGIRLITLPIGEVYSSYMALLGSVMPAEGIGVTGENLQARIRGNLLMALSNRFGWLVLTTGNKSEVAVGYCTLYGDMAGGFAVLKDVPKTLVFALSRYRNRISPKPLIPLSTIRRKPTAELRPNQCDQDTLPPYGLLDRIIELYVEKDMSVAEIAARGIPRGIAERTAGMIDRNEYKRRQGPPGIKITRKAFGRDRRLPITNRFTAGPAKCPGPAPRVNKRFRKG